MVINDYTAHYGPRTVPPRKEDRSGFVTKEQAKEYIRSRKDLDRDAWHILPTKLKEHCTEPEHILWAAGYYPVRRVGDEFVPDVGSERWALFQTFLKKTGLLS